jgi:hypothetical protein
MTTYPLLRNLSRTLGLPHVCLFVAISVPAGIAHAATFTSEIQLLNLDGSLTPGAFAASATPLTRTLTSAVNSGLTGSTSADLGVLKASAAVPTWTGTPEPYTYYQAASTASYIDVLTFTRPGGGMIDVSFSFAFDGRVIDPAPPQADRAALTLGMTLSGASGSVSTTSTRDYYFRDGVRNPRYDHPIYQFAPCRAGGFGQSPLICQQKNSFSYSSSGDKVGTATFTFSVLSGQAVKVVADMQAFVYSDPYLSTAASYDFLHTATLTGIATPDGTDVFSEAVGTLVSTRGGVTYAPALAATVPEPQSIVLMLAGLGLLGGWARRQSARTHGATSLAQ